MFCGTCWSTHRRRTCGSRCSTKSCAKPPTCRWRHRVRWHSRADHLSRDVQQPRTETRQALGVCTRSATSEVMRKAQRNHELTSYLRARGWERRARVLEPLTTETPTADVLEIARRALVDREELVRIAALEACGDLKVHEVLPVVAKLLRDRDPLVRGVAAISYQQLGGDEQTLRKQFERERSDAARVRIAFALFGKRGFSAATLLRFLQSDDYRVRCAVINLSSELRISSKRFVTTVQRLVNTDVPAVSETAKRRLRELRSAARPAAATSRAALSSRL